MSSISSSPKTLLWPVWSAISHQPHAGDECRALHALTDATRVVPPVGWTAQQLLFAFFMIKPKAEIKFLQIASRSVTNDDAEKRRKKTLGSKTVSVTGECGDHHFTKGKMSSRANEEELYALPRCTDKDI